MARVVVINPDPGGRAASAGMLRDLGHAVETVATADEAASVGALTPATVVLASISADGSDIGATWERLTAHAVGAVLWTGTPSPGVAAALNRGQGVGFVPDPPSPAALGAAVEKHGAASAAAGAPGVAWSDPAAVEIWDEDEGEDETEADAADARADEATLLDADGHAEADTLDDAAVGGLEDPEAWSFEPADEDGSDGLDLGDDPEPEQDEPVDGASAWRSSFVDSLFEDAAMDELEAAAGSVVSPPAPTALAAAAPTPDATPPVREPAAPPASPGGAAVSSDAAAPEAASSMETAERYAPRAEGMFSGLDALEAVDGDSVAYPPVRVLFLAHRVSATGSLHVGAVRIGLQGGRVVSWSGLPGLIAAALGQAPQGGGPDDLMGQLGAAIGMGAAPDAAMRAAAEGLGDRIAGWSLAPPVAVRWQPNEWGSGAVMPLPRTLPQILAGGNGRVRDARHIRKTLGSARNRSVVATPPNDSPQHQWALPPVALRLVREADKVATLGELLGSAGAETDATWQAVDLVLQLGLVGLGAVAESSAPPRRPKARVAPSAPPDAITVEPVAPTAPEPEPEPDARPGTLEDKLKGILAKMKGQAPHEILGVVTAADASVDGLDALFLIRSTEFHPDRYAPEGRKVQRLAQVCFSRINEAREALQDSDVRIELVERLRAEEEGRPWASAEDKRRAVLIGKKGEIALKRQAWAEAYALLDEASETDPTSLAYRVNRLHAGWRAGELAGAAVVEDLLAIKDLTRGEQADVFALVGEIMLREGMDEDRAYELLQKAVDRNPELIEPKRRLRLRDMRRRKEEAERTQRSGALRGLLRWGRGGDGDGDGEGKT